MKTGRIIMATAVLFMYSIFASATLASVNDDQVTSQKIKEADGLTSQNTNTGSGVKTGHIQDGAVTDAKITGPISASKISSNGLDADTVDGKHAADLALAVHTHPQSQVTGLEAALAGKADVLHNHDSLYQQKYGKVAVVALTGGDYTDPFAAANDADRWCPSSGPTNPCLLKIMPGVYDIGAAVVVLRDYIDMEGSGENVTIIRGAGGISGGLALGQVVMSLGGQKNEVRSLTVENYGPGAYGTTMAGIANVTNLKHVTVKMLPPNGVMRAHGVYTGGINGSFISLTDVKVSIDSQATVPSAMWGIYLDRLDSAEINNVSISAKGSAQQMTGIFANGIPSISIRNSAIDLSIPGGIGFYPRSESGRTTNAVVMDTTISASLYGINAAATPTEISHSSVTGGTNSILYLDSTYVAHSKLVGPLSNDGGAAQIKCIGNYDANYSPITCPGQ